MKNQGVAGAAVWLICLFQSQVSTAVAAADTLFTYQGRVTAHGTNFSGVGYFKFALVTSTNFNHQAAAVANMGGLAPNQFVSSCTVTTSGNGYATPPAVAFSGGGGSGAAGQANVSGGMVQSITILTPGAGYSTAPAVLIAPPPPNIAYVTYWSNDGTSVAGNEPAAGVSVNVNNGLFTVVLGDRSVPNMAPLDPSIFAQPALELRIWFDDGVSGFAALDPTQRLTAAPYAIAAQSASNLLGVLPAGQLSGTYSSAVNLSNSSNVLAGSFTGNGADVTNISSGSLVLFSTNISVSAWGWNDSGQRDVPPGLTDVTAVSAGIAHSLALRRDGTVAAWGAGLTNEPGGSINSGQSLVPASLNSVAAIAAGYLHSVALRSNGTAVAWGWNDYSQTNVPAGLGGLTAISAGAYHTLALKNDGTVTGWGTNSNGQLSIPAGLNNVVAISAGILHSLALRSDGTVVAWGAGTTNDPTTGQDFGQSIVPAGLGNVVAIAAGGVHSLALRANGTVVAWGAGTTNDPTSFVQFGQSIVPPGLSNVVAIVAGFTHSAALKADGTIVAWGDNQFGQTSIPFTSALALAPGSSARHGLALRRHSDAPVAWLDSDNTFNGNIQVGGDVTISGTLSAAGDLRLADANLWLRGGTDKKNGLGWFGSAKTFSGYSAPSPDGPVLFGANGGGLATLGTNGTKVALSWDSLQRVGIGTTTPSARLSLGSDEGSLKLLLLDGYFRAGLGLTNYQFTMILPNSAHRFSFMDAPNGNELMTVSGYGNVGIGTPIPSAKLDVRGDVKLGSSGQYYAPGGEESLRIVRGVVRFDGVILAGTGFSISHTGTGAYLLTFSTAFSGMPTVTATVQHGLANTVTTSSVNTGSAYVLTWDGANASDQWFHFIAMGPR